MANITQFDVSRNRGIKIKNKVLLAALGAGVLTIVAVDGPMVAGAHIYGVFNEVKSEVAGAIPGMQNLKDLLIVGRLLLAATGIGGVGVSFAIAVDHIFGDK